MRHSENKKLLGTHIDIAVISDREDVNDRIAEVWNLFESIEEEFSRFRKDSALSRLNSLKQLRVSPRFLLVLRQAIEACKCSNGLFNPLVSVAQLGYSHSFDTAQFERGEMDSYDSDITKIQIEDDLVTLGPNQSLDFGGIAKWYAVDLAASMLLSFGFSDFFVNAGGDIRASGMNGSEPGWRIGVESPNDGSIIASFLLKDASVATSGWYRRKWIIENREYHHIVHPVDGTNKRFFKSVTLLANDCVIADSRSKCIFNLPLEEALDFLQKQHIDAILIGPDDRIYKTLDFDKKYQYIDHI